MKQLSLVLVLLALASTAISKEFRSTTPEPRNVEYPWMSVADWYRAHADDVEVAARGEAKLLFLGDSIFQGWQWAPSWEREFADYRPANFGIGGDKTENLLWRIQNGATGKLDPQAVVVLIGVNNFGHNSDSPEAVYAGISANVKQAKASFPNAQIILLGVLPYKEKADSPEREKVAEVNRMLASLADESVRVLDVGAIFLDANGSIPKDVMGDFLHPTEHGYDLLAQALAPIIAPLFEH